MRPSWRTSWGREVREQPLDVRDPGDARRYLLAAAGRRERRDADEAAAGRLAALLGCLPLALEQAAAYVERYRLSSHNLLIDPASISRASRSTSRWRMPHPRRLRRRGERRQPVGGRATAAQCSARRRLQADRPDGADRAWGGSHLPGVAALRASGTELRAEQFDDRGRGAELCRGRSGVPTAGSGAGGAIQGADAVRRRADRLGVRDDDERLARLRAQRPLPRGCSRSRPGRGRRPASAKTQRRHRPRELESNGSGIRVNWSSWVNAP